jgi:hypothetical protein
LGPALFSENPVRNSRQNRLSGGLMANHFHFVIETPNAGLVVLGARSKSVIAYWRSAG